MSPKYSDNIHKTLIIKAITEGAFLTNTTTVRSKKLIDKTNNNNPIKLISKLALIGLVITPLYNDPKMLDKPFPDTMDSMLCGGSCCPRTAVAEKISKRKPL